MTAEFSNVEITGDVKRRSVGESDWNRFNKRKERGKGRWCLEEAGKESQVKSIF